MHYDPSALPHWPDRGPLPALQRPASLHPPVRHAVPHRLRADDRGSAPVPPVGVAHTRPPRGAPHARDRGDDRPARPGLRQRCAGHGRGRALPAGPVRTRAVRPPHLRRVQRRRSRGGDQPRGGLAGRAPRARATGLRLRRQPHLDRRPDRAGAERRRPASASRPTAGTWSTSARRPTTSTPSRPACAGPWRSRTAPRCSSCAATSSYPSPKYTDTAFAHGQRRLGEDEVRVT